jgi:hypothetical protein
MEESNTTPKPWFATRTDRAPDPSVSRSDPTKPATDPVPYVIWNGAFRVWYVAEERGSKRECVMHAGLVHAADGTHVSEEPVSKQPVYCWGGEPSSKMP